MDSSQNRGERRNRCLPCLLLLLTLLRQTDTISDRTWKALNNSSQSACSENEYENNNGVCCDKCPPGFKLTKKCAGVSLRSQCEKCSNGTFQDKTNYFENCFRCSKCKTKSAGKQDTVCTCKDLHYRVSKKTCAFCTNCSLECDHLCQVFPSSKTSVSPANPTDTTPHRLLILGIVLSMAFTVGVIVYEVFRKWRKSRRTSQPSSTSKQPPDPESSKVAEDPKYLDLQFVEDESPLLTCPCVMTNQALVLPDCVPREIKRHDFIYFVLDVVPIGRFKELVRRLNVSEQDIERAERDNRAFIDAQYQMLKVWSDGGNGGGGSVLPQSLVHECVSTLKDMNLNGSAESIENKFCAEAQMLTAPASADTQLCT